MRGYEKGNEGKGGGEFAGNTAIRRTDGKKETGRKKDGGSAMRTREVQIRVSDPVISRAPRWYTASIR